MAQALLLVLATVTAAQQLGTQLCPLGQVGDEPMAVLRAQLAAQSNCLTEHMKTNWNNLGMKDGGTSNAPQRAQATEDAIARLIELARAINERNEFLESANPGNGVVERTETCRISILMGATWLADLLLSQEATAFRAELPTFRAGGARVRRDWAESSRHARESRPRWISASEAEEQVRNIRAAASAIDALADLVLGWLPAETRGKRTREDITLWLYSVAGPQGALIQ